MGSEGKKVEMMREEGCGEWNRRWETRGGTWELGRVIYLKKDKREF
jgi:hypothetical protein